ncbi:hypothetical protein F3J24_17365 [Comamonas sp. Tr-654]|uniref:hypothetical protein n=1 Tax=Comamonas sp. Tr-654 TaxID=2608341 RepID=UPI001422311E|nr:hypothetical protein [Comamonas sp. Tr-654]NIF85283.1 hypothetical protein [Comamonas sp. Tr-654]
MELIRSLALAQLTKAMNCSCPSTIPRSGESGEKVNCFAVYIDIDKKPYLLVERIDGETLDCLEWNGERFADKKTINFSEVLDNSLSVTHFYGLSEVNYRGFKDFVIGRLLRAPYAILFFKKVAGALEQYLFNKKKLVTKQRIELLNLMVRLHLEGKNVPSPIGLMSHLYSLKWVLHPDRAAQIKKIQLTLDSFVDSGEISSIQNGEYRVNGKALHTIELFEEQERKHRESVIIQRLTIFLSIAIVILTAVQAEILKIPTIWDLTK